MWVRIWNIPRSIYMLSSFFVVTIKVEPEGRPMVSFFYVTIILPQTLPQIVWILATPQGNMTSMLIRWRILKLPLPSAHSTQLSRSTEYRGPNREDVMVESDRELSAMAQALWDNDVNRLQPGKDYRISLQVNPEKKRAEQGPWPNLPYLIWTILALGWTYHWSLLVVILLPI